MKIILTQNIPKIGSAGTIKDVATGYARNFLFKQKLAALATPEAIAAQQAKEAKAKQQQAALEAELQTIATKLNGLKLTINAAANNQGKLFAGIDPNLISQELKTQCQLAIKPGWLYFDGPIKAIGDYKINFKISQHHSQFIVTVEKGN